MDITYKTRYWCACGNHHFNDPKPHRKAKGMDCGKGNIRDYPMESIIYCCDDMREAFDDGIIKFGAHEYGADSNVNIIDCKAWPEGASYSETPIRFCPFCGENIITKNIGDL